MDIPSLPRCTSPATYTNQGHMPMNIALYALPRCTSLRLKMIWDLYYKERNNFMRNTFIQGHIYLYLYAG